MTGQWVIDYKFFIFRSVTHFKKSKLNFFPIKLSNSPAQVSTKLQLYKENINWNVRFDHISAQPCCEIMHLIDIN